MYIVVSWVSKKGVAAFLLVLNWSEGRGEGQTLLGSIRSYCHPVETISNRNCTTVEVKLLGNCSSGVKELVGAGNTNSLQYSCLEKFHGQRSLAESSPRGCKEWDMTEHIPNRELWYHSPLCLSKNSTWGKMIDKWFREVKDKSHWDLSDPVIQSTQLALGRLRVSATTVLLHSLCFCFMVLLLSKSALLSNH